MNYEVTIQNLKNSIDEEIKVRDQAIAHLQNKITFLLNERNPEKISAEAKEFNKAKDLMGQLLDILVGDKYVSSPCQWEKDQDY